MGIYISAFDFIDLFASDNYLIFICSDLGINKLTTLNKNAFRMLALLSELDLFDNEIDYLPDNIFDQLESLKYL